MKPCNKQSGLTHFSSSARPRHRHSAPSAACPTAAAYIRFSSCPPCAVGDRNWQAECSRMDGGECAAQRSSQPAWPVAAVGQAQHTLSRQVQGARSAAAKAVGLRLRTLASPPQPLRPLTPPRSPCARGRCRPAERSQPARWRPKPSVRSSWRPGDIRAAGRRGDSE